MDNGYIDTEIVDIPSTAANGGVSSSILVVLGPVVVDILTSSIVRVNISNMLIFRSLSLYALGQN